VFFYETQIYRKSLRAIEPQELSELLSVNFSDFGSFDCKDRGKSYRLSGKAVVFGTGTQFEKLPA
jgi:hypothetical protein